MPVSCDDRCALTTSSFGKRARLLLICLASAPLPWLFSSGQASTIGGAMGNAAVDGRPIVWKNRDGGTPTGNNRHFLSLIGDRTYGYLGFHPSDLEARMGMNEAGIGFGNATGHPGDGSATFTSSPNYSYSNNQAFKQFILGETSDLEQIRQAIADNTLGNASYWPTSLGIMPGIFDANGNVALWEIGDQEFYEYNPENSARLNQIPWQIYARDNTVHTQSDHTDDWEYTGSRYTRSRDELIDGAAAGGLTIIDFARVARIGEPGFDNFISRVNTSSTMIAHGVLEGEDPRISTLWAALGQPDYVAFIPVWVAIGQNLSPRVATNSLDGSLGGVAEKLWDKRETGSYDEYINSLLEPMERNFMDGVTKARSHWFRHGFDADEALRIHLEASETAFQTMNVMAAGSSRSLNVTPELTDINASVSGLTATFEAVAADPDGVIVAYDWDFGDGMTATGSSPVHTFAAAGHFLVRLRVTDDAGARNSRWTYVSAGNPPEGSPVVTLSAADEIAGEPGSDIGILTVSRAGPTAGPLTVNLEITGTASPGSDYVPLNGTVTIPDGETDATIVVSPLDDAIEEVPETVIVTLAAGVSYVVGHMANASILIQDNETVLVFQEGDEWRYFKGSSLPPDGWDLSTFDDGQWLSGPTGMGYGDGDDNTVLSDMRGNYFTVYMRKIFNVDEPGSIGSMTLNVDYDDGFVAFLNGNEVARAGVSPGQDNSTPAANHEAGTAEAFDLSSAIDDLLTGSNVFAIEVHNTTLNSSDLSMIPELTIESIPPACADAIDNDNDGLIDFPDDPGCESASDTSEIDDAIDVPDVTGQVQATAEANLLAAGLTVGVVTTTASAAVPAGSVISQDPSACAACAQQDDAVDLVVSTGPANEAPAISITSPADGTSVAADTVLTFAGTATDPEDGDLSATISWSSSKDGPLGIGAAVSLSLSNGQHTITAAVSDGQGSESSAEIRVRSSGKR